jgi:large subunit ribosomal protein L15
MTQYSLHNLKRPAGNRRPKKRVGRGSGSGKGTYSAKGLKGQKARSGGRRGIARRAAFQQLLVRTPKLRGFKRNSPKVSIVNISQLDSNFKDGEKVTPEILIKKRIAKREKGGIKILGLGKITKKLFVKANNFSESSKKAIKDAGGSFEIISK